MKKDLCLLLIVLGLLAGVGGFFFGYQKLDEKAKTLESQNIEDEAEIARLQGLEENRQQYLDDATAYNTEIAKLVNEFPSYVLPEDDIKYVYTHTDENEANLMLYNTMSFASPVDVYTTEGCESSNGTQYVEAVSIPSYTLYKAQTSYAIQCTYDSLKQMIRDIYNAEGHKTIENLTVVFDSSNGLLSGSLVSDSFFVYGQNKPYAQPTLAPVQFGTDNIFGTVEPQEVETAPLETIAE